jgi:hypothetical protein
MGIYESGNIFGIRIYNFNDDDISNILFEQKYNTIMIDEQKKDAYLFYNQLNNKNNIFFNIYTECSSTHDIINKDKFMMWYPISVNLFLEKFGI